MGSTSGPLELYFLPYISPGHMIPLFEMARLFAARGERVTIITTTHNAPILQKSIDKDVASGHHIKLHLVPFPAKEVGLPEGLENFFSVTDFETSAKLYYGLALIQEDIEEFISTHRPDCIFSDMFYPWTADLAVRLRVPRVVFQALGIFAQSLKEAMRQPDSPHLQVESDYEPFVIPNLPDPIVMKRSELPDYVRTPNGYTQLMEQWREAELKSYGILVNGFYEFESAYTEHYKKVMGNQIEIFHIGPAAAMIYRDAADKVERGHKTVVSEHECLSWLNSKNPSSVLYICFGSGCRFPDTQLMEIACGLEASGQQFIWVILGKDDEKEEDKEKWLPKGFDEKIKDRGMIIKGWAPQVLILDHPSVGGFMTHCGWNSVLEAVTSGIPVIAWPLYAEQFYNEKLLTHVLRVSVAVGVEDWNFCFEPEKRKLIDRLSIEKAVRRLMDGGDEAIEMRRKMEELKEMAMRAVENGGSSHRNLTTLIEQLKKMRDQRAPTQ